MCTEVVRRNVSERDAQNFKNNVKKRNAETRDRTRDL